MGDAMERHRYSLLDLPNEMLTEIFSQLCHHCHPPEPSWPLPHKPSLAALCRVSKHTSSLATPILYHSLDGGRVFMFETLRFLNTVFKRPDLAAHVRVFAPFVRRRCVKEITPELIQVLNDTCRLLRVNPRSYNPLRRELCIAVFLKELALRAPALAELTLVPIQLATCSEEQDALRSLATDPTRPLRNLKKIDLYHETESESLFSLGDLNTDLLLAAAANNLECLELNGFHLVSSSPSRLPVLPNVREVTLTLCSLDSGNLGNLVKILPNLERFSYTSKGEPNIPTTTATDALTDDGITTEEEFNPAEATIQLYRRRETLKHISLGMPWSCHQWFMFGTEEITRSYAGFSTLEFLELHSSNIFAHLDNHKHEASQTFILDQSFHTGVSLEEKPQPLPLPLHLSSDNHGHGGILVELIPPSLMHLIIRGPCPYHEAAALASAATVGGRFPQLRTVSFEAVVPAILREHQMYNMWTMDRERWANLKGLVSSVEEEDGGLNFEWLV